MKSKKRHQSSSEESEESEASVESKSSSESDSEESSASEHRHKKKRKRADSSDSESDSDDQRRSKKRKHKKKKKKHGKKKRRSESPEENQSVEEVSSVSEGEISPKKKRKHKHKHKHSKRARSSSASVIIEEEEPTERRLHSVVKERRESSEERGQPRTYYPRDYHQSTAESVERDREVQRFYRGSSKERRYQEHYRYTHERNDRFQYDKHKYSEKYDQTHSNEEDYSQRQRHYDEYKRNQRYEEHRSPVEEYQKRPRDDNYHSREDPRGFNRYNQHEDRRPKRPDYDNGRDYRERRPPPEERYREREYPDKRERFREEGYVSERPRDGRRDRPFRPEPKPFPPHHREQSRSRSPEPRYKSQERRRPDERAKSGLRDERPERPADSKPPRDRKSRFTNVDEKDYTWGKAEAGKEAAAPGDKEKPNFGLSGKLTAEANTVNGVVIKYAEPDDAKQPKRRWRFYPFKGDKALPILYIHRQSCFLIGRDKKVVDIALEHPSISKQHAVLQYRCTPFTRPDGTQGRRVRPYVIDLDSANGTFVNNKKVEARRYVELLERDVVKFGFSAREYVLLHENSKDDAQDDDNQEPAAAVATTDQIKREKRVKQEVVEDGE
ncbi:smad nuclear-interacting protein 1 isoform X1 [Cydia splendana]|uniref:smad nuclear-interacting protein 1 isoform X1 n=1 Tax=Cydia splendana TaxID=1100963 RepID=UPI0028F4C3B7